MISNPSDSKKINKKQQKNALLEEDKKYTFAPTIPVRASSIIIDDQAPVFDRLNSSRQYMQNILSQVRTCVSVCVVCVCCECVCCVCLCCVCVLCECVCVCVCVYEYPPPRGTVPLSPLPPSGTFSPPLTLYYHGHN